MQEDLPSSLHARFRSAESSQLHLNKWSKIRSLFCGIAHVTLHPFLAMQRRIRFAPVGADLMVFADHYPACSTSVSLREAKGESLHHPFDCLVVQASPHSACHRDWQYFAVHLGRLFGLYYFRSPESSIDVSSWGNYVRSELFLLLSYTLTSKP
jgi:hypothetical protein